MKNLIIISLLLVITTGSFAQPASGKMFLTGTFSVYTSKDKTRSNGTTQDGVTSTTIAVLPGAGYFLSDRMVAGTYLGINLSTDKDANPSFGDPGKVTQTILVFSPFFRYYLITGNGGIFTEASFSGGFGKHTSDYEGGSVEYNSVSLSFGVSPGVYYYITDKLALEAKFGWLGFDSMSYKDDNKYISSGFGLQLYPDSFAFGLTIQL